MLRYRQHSFQSKTSQIKPSFVIEKKWISQTKKVDGKKAKQASNLIKNATSTSDSHPRTFTTETIENIYQKKTPVEHVLLRPDTYVGGIEKKTEITWIYDSTIDKYIKWECSYVPALYKIFDEILVNAADNRQRDPSMTSIKVNIDKDTQTISVWNNGKGIPVEMHPKEKLYVPELVLGNLFTGSNFDDKKLKTTGGRNGYGAKLTNIFSTHFEVETVDSQRGLKYVQKWDNNMSVKSEPEISNIPKKTTDYTQITFRPDLQKFGMTKFDSHILRIFERRVRDVAACNEDLEVTLNGKPINCSFKDYISKYIFNLSGDQEQQTNLYILKPSPRWQIALGVSSEQSFEQVSFVNSIFTSRGGTHVNYIADQVAKYVLEQLKVIDKDIRLTLGQVKNHLCVFVNCLVENPAFDSQTKETLLTKPSHFGSSCILKEKELKAFIDSSQIIEKISQWLMAKKQGELMAKMNRSQSGNKITGIPKLYDANLAGTERSKDCTLIITEGDSAKSLAVSGLSILGRDLYGVFPLRGKLLNVRQASEQQVSNNAEINHLLTIVGLDPSAIFKANAEQSSSPLPIPNLRYGKIMLMTDQDHDGSHIKGLFMNFIHYFWPSLLKDGNFLEEFITPIIKTFKGKQKMVFYTIPEFENWKQKLPENELKNWTVKYYKGLGTNTTEEAKDYFQNLEKHRIKFVWTEGSNEALEMAFVKELANKRKEWLQNFKEGTFLDHTKTSVSIPEFINKELILFSRADLIRSIPSIVDGLKPAQRKVLFSAFKRNLDHEIKVVQLSGYVAEQTCYHHGEASLNGTIINMAQNFVGANNLPLFFPSGQFGTRLQGGDDSASPRYLFTRLSKYSRKIFSIQDDPLLKYCEEDGVLVQPEYYVPIIPMILVNGTTGVGTGWSTYIPSYNPIQIIDNLLNKIEGKSFTEMSPYFHGFKGKVEKRQFNSFTTNGIVEKIDSQTLKISELPVGVWVEDYKAMLDELVKPTTGIKPLLKGFTTQHTESSVTFMLKLTKLGSDILFQSDEAPQKLKLSSSIKLSNMHLFDASGNLKNYSSPTEILEEFFDVRKMYYENRKGYILKKLQKEVEKLTNKTRFCDMVLNQKLQIFNRPKTGIVEDLKKQNFEPESTEESTGYDYLLDTPLLSLTQERIQKLKNEETSKSSELTKLVSMTPVSLWKNELLDLKKDVQKYFDKVIF